MVFIAKDLTKEYEQVFFGPINEVIEKTISLKDKGEFVVCVAKEKYHG